MDRRTFNQLSFLALGAVAGKANRASAANSLAASTAPATSTTETQNAPKTGGVSRKPWDHYLFGTAYYPEWWEPSEWLADFGQMQQLGINTVRMGEFAWALFEPAPGRFEFAWMDRAIDIANRQGIDVVLATPTASVPPWLYQLHPDVLSGNEIGPYTYGGRKGYCTSSPNYLAASARITAALAAHYGRHPGVIGWQLDNEPGYPFQAYDPVSERAFQDWLKKQYGTLEALNRAWNGAFRSNKFTDWGQIHIPRNSAEGGWQPAISLAYRRFFSDSFLHHLRQQAMILRREIKNQFIFTNWPSATWSVDVFAGAGFLDATAWDNYCSAPGLSEFQHQYISGFNGDFCRCAGARQRYLCAEQIAYVPANALAEGLRLQAYINLAHGSHGHRYFEWRRPLAGGEQYRPSFIKRFDGTINPAEPVFRQTSREFVRLGPRLAAATTRADVALLYDFTNESSQGFWSVGDRESRYDSEAMRYYRGFKVLQRNIDVIPLAADFTPYVLIVAPNLRLIEDATVVRVSAFVSGGGILVLNYRAGTQNMDNSMRRALPPGPFTEMAGVKGESNLNLVEYAGLDKSLLVELAISFAGMEKAFRPRTMLESLTLHGAEPVATFRGGRMEGRPAITRHRHGKGWVFYVGTDSAEDGFHESLARVVATTGNLSPLLPAPYGVEVVSREDSAAIYYFLLNLTETTHHNVTLPRPMEDLIASRTGVTSVSLEPLDVAVVAAPKIADARGEG